MKPDNSDVKSPRQEEVWAAGETKAVGLAFVVGCVATLVLLSPNRLLTAFFCAPLVFFSLWFIVALLQIATRALMVSATACIMAQQDGAKR